MKIGSSYLYSNLYQTGLARGSVSGGASTIQRDTVTLSSEARRLLEHFRSMEFEDDKDQASESAPTSSFASGVSNGERNDTSAPAGSAASAVAGGGGASAGSDTASQIEEIRKKIKDLQDKVEHIMSSDMSPDQKQSAAAPYLQQIQELQQQLQSLMAGSPKNA